MVGRGLRREHRHRRQDAAQIAGEEDDGARLAGAVRRDLGGDVRAGIAGAGVLGEARIGVVGFAGAVVDDDVLDDGAEADGVEDHRLRFAREVDALGVAAALEIEHRARAPAVFVVADQQPFRVRGKRRLAGAGKPEEQRHVAVRASVGRAVHRQHVAVRQQEVLHREHRLLHLAGVAQADQQHAAAGEVDHRSDIRGGAVALRHADEGRRVEHCPHRLVLGIVGVRRNEQRLGEERVPSVFRGHRHRQIVVWMGADVERRDEGAALRQMRFDAAGERGEDMRLHRLVDVAPVDGGCAARLADDEAVRRRAPGALAGLHHEGAVAGQAPLAAQQGEFRQHRARQVVPDEAASHVEGVRVKRHGCSSSAIGGVYTRPRLGRTSPRRLAKDTSAHLVRSAKTRLRPPGNRAGDGLRDEVGEGGASPTLRRRAPRRMPARRGRSCRSRCSDTDCRPANSGWSFRPGSGSCPRAPWWRR